MNGITLSTTEILEDLETVMREKTSKVEGIVDEKEYSIEFLREEKKGVEEPFVEVRVDSVPT